MLPINQVILGGADPLLNTGSLTDQIQYLEEQKRLIEARQRQIQQAANGQQTLQQVSSQQTAKVSVWDLIDAEVEPLTNEQRTMLANNEEMVMNILINRKLNVLLMKCTMSKTVRNISVRNTICRKLTKFVVNSKIN